MGRGLAVGLGLAVALGVAVGVAVGVGEAPPFRNAFRTDSMVLSAPLEKPQR